MPLPFVVFVSRHALVLTALFSWRYSRSPWACNGAWTSFLAPCASCSVQRYCRIALAITAARQSLLQWNPPEFAFRFGSLPRNNLNFSV
jgi:hypothetical protein